MRHQFNVDFKIKGTRTICVDTENFDKLSKLGVGRRYRTVNIYCDLLYQQKKLFCRYTYWVSFPEKKKKKPIMLVILGNWGIVRVGERSF